MDEYKNQKKKLGKKFVCRELKKSFIANRFGSTQTAPPVRLFASITPLFFLQCSSAQIGATLQQAADFHSITGHLEWCSDLRLKIFLTRLDLSLYCHKKTLSLSECIEIVKKNVKKSSFRKN